MVDESRSSARESPSLKAVARWLGLDGRSDSGGAPSVGAAPAHGGESTNMALAQAASSGRGRARSTDAQAIDARRTDSGLAGRGAATGAERNRGKDMNDPHRDAALTYVARVLEHTGWSASVLAAKAGVAQTTITRFRDVKTTHSLSARTLSKISLAAGLPLPPALGGGVAGTDWSSHAGTSIAGAHTPGTDRHGAATRDISYAGMDDPGVASGFLRDKIPSAGYRDLPVLGHGEAGREGFFLDNGIVQSYVERPWFLMGNANGYAVYVHDASMEPVYRHGNMLYVDPSRPVGRDDDVVIELGDGRAFVKRFVTRRRGTILVRQFNPIQELEFAESEVRAMHMVVGSMNVRS